MNRKSLKCIKLSHDESNRFLLVSLLSLSLSSARAIAQERVYKAVYKFYQSDDKVDPSVSEELYYALELYPSKTFFYNEKQRLFDSVYYEAYKVHKNSSLAYEKAWAAKIRLQNYNRFKITLQKN